MKHITKPQLHELLIYTALWLVIFTALPAGVYLKTAGNEVMTFRWTDVYKLWYDTLPFFILFLIHNFWLAPRLLLKKKTLCYVLSLVGLLAIFQLTQNWSDRARNKGFDMPARTERHEPPRGRQEQPFRTGQEMPPQAKQGTTPPEMGNFPSPEEEKFNSPQDQGKPGHKPKQAKPNRNGPKEPPGVPARQMQQPQPLFLDPDMLRFIIALLMIGFNIGIKLLFKSQQDEKILNELERHNLQRELEYLKYQINPHFFMNTLNNIHALVDIDAEKAKYTILELSKLMRYLLYEGAKRTVTLSREIEFLKHYITLMSLRYTDKVKIQTDIPEEVPEIQIPPLLFITFVENAFKHGISYQSESFICLSLKLEEKQIIFHCINSNQPSNQDPHSGIGLENMKKRLKLLYGDNFHLSIEADPKTYKVLLEIPVKI